MSIFASPDGITPHPRHISFDFDAVGMQPDSAVEKAFLLPEAFAEAKLLMTNLGAAATLDIMAGIVNLGSQDA